MEKKGFGSRLVNTIFDHNVFRMVPVSYTHLDVYKRQVLQDGLSYQEAAKIYEVQGHDRIQSWERIYLEEGPEGLALERRGRRSPGRPKKLPRRVNSSMAVYWNNRSSGSVIQLRGTTFTSTWIRWPG